MWKASRLIVTRPPSARAPFKPSTIAGGRSYDAVIAACASQAHAVAPLTLNGRHFEPFATREMVVVVPQEPA